MYIYPGAKHSAPFKPSHPAKKGYNKTLQKFPVYREDQGKKVAQKSREHYAKQSGYWKHPTKYRSKVCPTIIHHLRNEKPRYFESQA